MKETKKMVLMGKEVNVVNWIPYARKIEAAKEYVAMAYSFHDDVGVVCENYMEPAVELMLKMKYYTDMDVSEYSTEEALCRLMDEAHDDAENMNAFCELVERDSGSIFNSIGYRMAQAVMDVYERENSIGHRIMKSFGFLFDGKDITQTLAESREVSEQMVDHLGAIAKAKDVLEANARDTVDLSEFAKRKKD